MNADRELLELAARAAGYEVEFMPMSGANIVSGPRVGLWRPLEDDGDALRLAVELGICVEFGDCADDAPVVYAGIAHERRDWPMWPRFPDAMAATRRAIVRAAAELGRSMP